MRSCASVAHKTPMQDDLVQFSLKSTMPVNGKNLIFLLSDIRLKNDFIHS